MFDAHSHFPSPDAIVCSQNLTPPPGPSLFGAVGLLPQDYREDNERKLGDLLRGGQFLLGEVGLDRRFEKTVPLREQEKNLRRLFALAREYGRPVILHCVRCDGLLLELLGKFPDLKFLWHGFNGSRETAMQLKKLGVLISIRPGFKPEVGEFIRQNPGDFVLESDYTGTDALEYNEILRSHYEKVCTMVGTETADLEEHCRDIGKVFAAEPVHR